ncbi:hypothetical protein BDV12DRAFT_201595 [Aspergillus spectabilis]
MRPLPTGIYTPLPCFFRENEDLDLESFKKHAKFVAEAGTVPVVSGTMGEAVHLSHHEKAELVSAARSALDESQLHHVPVVAGAGAPSTRESIELCKEAAAVGADYVIVIPPGYYAGALLSDATSLRNFFVDISEASPVPVCANVGKLTRIMEVVNAPEFDTQFPRRFEFPFRAIDGFIDFFVAVYLGRRCRCDQWTAEYCPESCVKLWELCQSEDKQAEAQKLQNVISLADGIALKIGISGMKKILNRRFGYGERPRLPLLPMSDVALEKVLENALENAYWKDLLETEELLYLFVSVKSLVQTR